MKRELFGVDYSWARPGPGCLAQQGVDVVLRYLSRTAGHRIDVAEKNRILGAGLGLALVWETTAQRTLSGHAGGAADAREAQRQLEQLGLAGLPIYFAADWDVTEAQSAAVHSYLRGAGAVLGGKRVGLYGGYWPVKRAFDAGVIAYGWQTYAWSGGHVEERAHVYQYSNGHNLCGGQVDYNRVAPHAAIVGKGGVDQAGQPVDLLTADERKLANRRCYHRRKHMHARRGSKTWLTNLGWARWYKARIRRQMRRIQKLARSEKNGWVRRHRGARYQILARYWTGKACK